MDLEKIQRAFQNAGYQWTEQIYNDGHIHDCSIEFTRDKSPHALSTYPKPDDCVGWGRFSRAWAWRQAYDWLKEKQAKAA